MATKATTPNAAQSVALTEGLTTGFLPAATPNQTRTAKACVTRGWATEVDGTFPITNDGRTAVGAAPVEVDAPTEAPAEEPVIEVDDLVAIAEELLAAPADEEPAVTVDVKVTEVGTPQGGTAGQILVLHSGTRVYHTEKVVGGCNGDDHAQGELTGEWKVKQGRVHVQVKLDCGHTRFPLLRVLIVAPMTAEWLAEFTAQATQLAFEELAVAYHALGLTAPEAASWANKGYAPGETAFELRKVSPQGLAAATGQLAGATA